MKQILRWAGIVVIGVAGACWLCAGVMAQEATVRNVERTWVEPTKTDDDGSGARQAQIKLAAAQTRYEYLLVRKESIDPEVMGAFEALKLAKEELRQYTGYWIETVPDDGNKNQWKEDDRDGTDDGDVGTPLGTETFSYLVDAQKKPLVSTAPVYGSETFNLTVDPSTGTRRINLVIRGHVVDPEGLGWPMPGYWSRWRTRPRSSPPERTARTRRRSPWTGMRTVSSRLETWSYAHRACSSIRR